MENNSSGVAAEKKVDLMDRTAETLSLGSGLLGWMTIVFAFSSLGYYPMGGMVMLVVLFCGLGFFMVSLTCWKKGNEFGAFTFGMITVFAFSFAAFNLLPGTGMIAPPTPTELGTFMTSFALIIGAICLVTMLMPVRLLTIVIGLASVMFLCVGLHFFTLEAYFMDIVGYLAIVVGVLSTYMGIALVVNGLVKKEMLPILMKH